MKIFYISDLHLCHKNIIKLCDRPYATVEEMNEDIVKKWNKTVSQEDEVRILGDVGFPKNNEDIEKIIALIKRLNGKKILVSGNHDFKLLKNEEFRSLFVDISDYMRVKDNDRDIILSHYPIEEWDGFYRGYIHLYGHVHNNEVGLKHIRNRYNVGLEVLGYVPRTLDEIIELNKVSENPYEVTSYLTFECNSCNSISKHSFVGFVVKQDGDKVDNVVWKCINCNSISLKKNKVVV